MARFSLCPVYRNAFNFLGILYTHVTIVMTLELVPRNPVKDALFPQKLIEIMESITLLWIPPPPVTTNKLSEVLKNPNTGLTFGFSGYP